MSRNHEWFVIEPGSWYSDRPIGVLLTNSGVEITFTLVDAETIRDLDKIGWIEEEISDITKKISHFYHNLLYINNNVFWPDLTTW